MLSHTSTSRGDEDSLSAVSHSSRISFECHHRSFLDELSRQADFSTAESSEDDSEDDEAQSYTMKQDRRSQETSGDGLIDKEISAVGHELGGSSKGSLHRVTSDLSVCSILEDEVSGLSQPQVEKMQHHTGSLLGMLEQRIIDREVKAGKIARTVSMDIGKKGQHVPRRTFSYHKSSNRVSSFLSIDENAEVTCSKNASFQDWSAPNPPRSSNQRSAASLMGHALLNVPSSSAGGAPKKRVSASLQTKGKNKLKLQDFGSIINDL